MRSEAWRPAAAARNRSPREARDPALQALRPGCEELAVTDPAQMPGREARPRSPKPPRWSYFRSPVEFGGVQLSTRSIVLAEYLYLAHHGALCYCTPLFGNFLGHQSCRHAEAARAKARKPHRPPQATGAQEAVLRRDLARRLPRLLPQCGALQMVRPGSAGPRRVDRPLRHDRRPGARQRARRAQLL